MLKNKVAKIGIIGTGFVGGGLKKTINLLPDMEVVSVLTRRDLIDFPDEDLYTHSVQELIDKSDIIVECNGDPVYATEIVCKILDAGLPVVTMDAELQITSGSYLSSLGLITEAEGDQPGALAAMKRNLVSMGFEPLVYGNLKGFLNLNPTHKEMEYWSRVQGISLEQVVGFTDGTKVNIEQALVANGLGAIIAKQGMFGLESDDIITDSKKLALKAKEIGQPISDYLLQSPQATKKFPAGVFITAEYSQEQAPALKYLKLGKGPYYTLIRNYHLVHLEIPWTIRQVLSHQDVLLDNSSNPTASVCAVAKKVLKPGTVIRRYDRNFQVRGEAISIKDAPNHVPFGLVKDLVVKHTIEPGQILEFDDLEVPPSKAYDAWRYTLDLVKDN
ncbi:MAG TPA: NAD(P)-dependent oxidoreductase [Clostridiales bacterium]|nr:NAD(P)-dependent oxidoreductase [Clostridiales bacterium]